MKVRSLCVLSLAAIALVGCSKNDDAGSTPPKQSVISPAQPADPAPSAELGKDLFLKECETCHGPGGSKSMPGMKKDAADLTGDYVQKKTDDELRKLIKEGKKGNPEMFGHIYLKDWEIESLVKYLRTLKK